MNKRLKNIEQEIEKKNTRIKAIDTETSQIEKKIKDTEVEIEKMAEERKSYSNYDRYMPDLYLGYERVDRSLRGDRYYRDQDIFSIRFSKKLFSTDSDYKLSELEVENLKNDIHFVEEEK